MHEREARPGERVGLDHEALTERVHQRAGDQATGVSALGRVPFVVEERLVETAQVHELHEVGLGDGARCGAEGRPDGHLLPGVAADRVRRVVARNVHGWVIYALPLG